MKQLICAMILALVAAPVAAQTPPNFRWAAFPNARQFSALYPKVAAQNKIEGTASLLCAVADAEGHLSCTLVSETPEMCGNDLDFDHPKRGLLGRVVGYPERLDADGHTVPVRCEFGKAAIAAVEKFGRAETAGGVTIGAQNPATVHFQLH